MRPYALTWPQLGSQAIAAGCPEAELARLRDAYELAERSSDGLYRPEGQPFLCHLVRAASIALAEGCDLDAVVGLLVHSGYQLHVFEGSLRRPPTRRERRVLRERFGGNVHELLEDWASTPWETPEALEAHVGHLREGAAPRTRRLLHLRIAHELEEQLDLGMAFRGARALRASRARRAPLLELAAALASPELAKELQCALDASLEAELPRSAVRERTLPYEHPLRRVQQRGAWVRAYKRLRRRWLGPSRRQEG